MKHVQISFTKKRFIKEATLICTKQTNESIAKTLSKAEKLKELFLSIALLTFFLSIQNFYVIKKTNFALSDTILTFKMVFNWGIASKQSKTSRIEYTKQQKRQFVSRMTKGH